MKKTFREPIQIRAVSLFLIFLTALIIIALTSYLSTSIANTYQERLDNQRMHQELGEVILANLTSLEGEFAKLASLKASRDLALTEERIEILLAEIQEIIQILQYGGVFIQNIPANFGDVDEIEITIPYTREGEGYLVEVLELLPRILDLEDISLKLFSAVDKGLGATAPDEKLATVDQISLLLKQTDTFLLRSRESANRIYYESHLEMQRTTIEKTKILKTVREVSLFITLIVALTGGSLSFYMLQQIGNLLQARTDAEDSLREAELRYRTVADFTYDWEYWRNPDGSMEYVSPACERITGYSPAYILERPNFLEEIVFFEDAQILREHGSETQREHAPREIRFRVRRKDGEVIWIEHACQPVTTPTGEFVGYRASNRDVTEKMMAQNALSESEERYRSLVEDSPIGILLVSQEGVIISVNTAALKMLGSPSKEATAKINMLTFPPLVKSGFVADFQTCLKSEKIIQNQTAYASKWGKSIYSRYTLTAIRNADRRLIGIQVLLEDITSRKEAEIALREKSIYLDNILRSSTEYAIATTDLDLYITYYNPLAEEFFGYTAEEVIGKTILEMHLKEDISPERLERAFENVRVHGEHRYLITQKREVGTRYLASRVSGIYDPEGKMVGYALLSHNITEQTRDKSKLLRRISNLATINTINTAIISNTNLDFVIATALEEITIGLAVDAADFLIFDEYALTLTCVAQHGFISLGGSKQTVLRVGEGYAGEAALKRKMIQVENLKDEAYIEKVPARWQDESFLTYRGIPLFVKGELKGILEIFHRTEENRDQAWMDFLETLAQQTAIAIDNHFLLDALRRSNLELELAYETTLEGWARALELRDYETQGHTKRVASLTLKLAQALGIHGEELTHIRRGALLHDIGKIAISDTILLKSGPCTPEEWELLHQHPQYGYDMLKEIAYLKPSLDIVLYHHEKWDGSGYPHGLAGENIPFSARIFAIVDVWDALLNDRPYHKAWTKEETLRYLKEEKGKHFDPRVVEAFMGIVERMT